MSSCWEIASDIVGAISAIALLVPAFGSNAISKRIEKVRAGLRAHKRDAAPADETATRSLNPDEHRMANMIALAERLKQRWTKADEFWLRFAAVFLVVSFVLKGIHHWASG